MKAQYSPNADISEAKSLTSFKVLLKCHLINEAPLTAFLDYFPDWNE